MRVLAASCVLLITIAQSSKASPPSVAATGADCPSTLSGAIPERSANALSGSEFLKQIWNLKGAERDRAILSQIESGNLPAFLRELKPVRLSARDKKGVPHAAIVCVMPDYLAVGSDQDFVRVPLGLRAATEAARRFGFVLPTRKVVDAVYQQASLRFAPKPLRPGPQMASTRYFATHNDIIEALRIGRPLGEMVSGHKKDVVLTKRLLTRRGRVAIYGWHRKPGSPIQPLSTVHGARYADYSHGVRLVSESVLVDGKQRSVYDVLRDSALAGTLTHEGTIRDARRLMGIPAPTSRQRADDESGC